MITLGSIVWSNDNIRAALMNTLHRLDLCDDMWIINRDGHIYYDDMKLGGLNAL